VDINGNPAPKPVLTEEEMQLIADNFVRTRLARTGKKPSVKDVTKVLQWAEETVIAASILEGVLLHELLIDWSWGEPIFGINPEKQKNEPNEPEDDEGEEWKKGINPHFDD